MKNPNINPNINPNENPDTIPDKNQHKNPHKNSGRKKKAILICFGAMCVLGALSWYLLYINPVFSKAEEEKKPHSGVEGMYGSNESHIFYPIDEELDVSTVREYMELDRQLYFKRGAETIAVDEDNIADYGEDVKFFYDYFKTVISGDYTTYNTLFTDNYFKKNEQTCDFTPQMLYDTVIEKLSEEVKDGKTVYTYNVTYKIFRNNGTFRNDIGSDGAKTLYLSLVKENGKILIDYIDYYV